MSKEFIWTDELVVEFTSWSLKDSPTFQGRYADLEQFKQFKSQPEQPKERIGEKIGDEIDESSYQRLQCWDDIYEFLRTCGLDEYKWELPTSPIKRAIQFIKEKFDKKYTDADLKQAEEKAFNAAREWTGLYFNTGGTGTMPAALPEVKQKYPTFQDYINSQKA